MSCTTVSGMLHIRHRAIHLEHFLAPHDDVARRCPAVELVNCGVHPDLTAEPPMDIYEDIAETLADEQFVREEHDDRLMGRLRDSGDGVAAR